MGQFLHFLFVLIFGAVSAIRMERDFSYPIVEDFKVYWNAPSSSCQKHGINLAEHTTKFGIITNSGDKFRGDKMVILYDPGFFPAMLKNKDGKDFERNGGIPQLGNLTAHLDIFRNAMETAVPQNFNGIGVIDFEAWRPIYRQNWKDQVVYKNMSKDLVRQYHPQWPESRIEAQAANDFEEAARIFMQTTLQMAKFVRPYAVWGYYAFPYCFNLQKDKKPDCREIVLEENDRIQWMIDESTALYPSLYLNSKHSFEDHRNLILGRLNEAWRMATRASYRSYPQIHPYLSYKYFDNDAFMSREDMYMALETTRKYKMGGAIIWGASMDVSSKEKCINLVKYVNSVLGPAVRRVQHNNDKDRELGLNFGFVKIPFNPANLLQMNKLNITNHSHEQSSTTPSPQPSSSSSSSASLPRLQNSNNGADEE